MEKWVAGRIVTRLGDLHYEIDYQGKRFKRHADQIRAHQKNGAILESSNTGPNDKIPDHPRRIRFFADPPVDDSTPFTTAPSTPNQSEKFASSTPEQSRNQTPMIAPEAGTTRDSPQQPDVIARYDDRHVSVVRPDGIRRVGNRHIQDLCKINSEGGKNVMYEHSWFQIIYGFCSLCLLESLV